MTQNRQTLPAPFLKWAGGKRSSLPAILQRLPAVIDGRYREHFLGGGAVFFELVRLGRVRSAVLTDINAELIDTYLAVRDVVDDVIDALRGHTNDREHFNRIRAQDSRALALAERAARMIFLNRCGFNGLYRVNRSGNFNVPFGHHRNPQICDEPRLRSASRALQIAELVAVDFATACSAAVSGDVVYLDPPYAAEEDASFTQYVRDGFDLNDQRRVRHVAGALAERGVHVVVSNTAAASIRALYGDGFRIEEVLVPRRISAAANRRGDVRELLITAMPHAAGGTGRS